MSAMKYLFAILCSIILVACGGGSGSSTPSSSTLSGVAAVGTPIANGTINIRCASGSALNTTTSSSGGWQVTLSGQTLPCAVEVSGGTINGVANTMTYHSIATAIGTVNVTPLTDLMVANLAGTATPTTWFTGLSCHPRIAHSYYANPGGRDARQAAHCSERSDLAQHHQPNHHVFHAYLWQC